MNEWRWRSRRWGEQGDTEPGGTGEPPNLRHVVLRLEDGGDEWSEQGRLHEPEESPEWEPGEVRRLQRRRLVPDGGDVHLLHRRHGTRAGPRPPPRGIRSAHADAPVAAEQRQRAEAAGEARTKKNEGIEWGVGFNALLGGDDNAGSRAGPTRMDAMQCQSKTMMAWRGGYTSHKIRSYPPSPPRCYHHHLPEEHTSSCRPLQEIDGDAIGIWQNEHFSNFVCIWQILSNHRN